MPSRVVRRLAQADRVLGGGKDVANVCRVPARAGESSGRRRTGNVALKEPGLRAALLPLA